MNADLLLAIDQGTTGTTALVMDREGQTLSRATEDFPQHFPKPGWVEHNPEEIWLSVERSVARALGDALGARIAAIGITNQRETSLLWDRSSGTAIHPAIVWQDRRTADRCLELRNAGHLELVREKTGLVLDPYFSGTKLEWLLRNVDGARAAAAAGKLAFGTIDSYLVWKITGGAHVTDVTNASRTLLMNLTSCAWDSDMLELLSVPQNVLPTIVASAGVIGVTKSFAGLRDGIPIAGIAGDQQAALFGQGCFSPGEVKCTYGTGAFVLSNIGAKPKPSSVGLLTTVAWRLGDETTYAHEGSSFVAGAAVQWLRDGLGLIRSAGDIEPLACGVSSSGGVVFVPALAGLGAPYWDAEARGLICGLTRGSTAAHIARAVLEGIAFSVADLLDAMGEATPLKRMRVDGGAAANSLLMQMQSDFSNISIERPRELESTARGAAMLAGVGAGLFGSPAEALSMSRTERTFTPEMSAEDRNGAKRLWSTAIARARLTG
jgi:glycerol kinase